jgi:primosomal protein N''
MALMSDKLRQELADLQARLKPQSEWTSMQDRLDQKAIENRIHILRNYLERPEGKPR